MKAFAALLDALVFVPQRTAKLRLLADYFAATGDPERGYAAAALTGELAFRHAKPALIRAVVAARTDPYLFALSHDFVGDLAETAALIWPATAEPAPAAPTLTEVVETLSRAERDALPTLLAGWLEGLDASGRFALLKLITGAMRVGASARLVKTALADWGGVPLAEVEETWHALAPPYLPLFAWLEGRAARPVVAGCAVFRPMMLATALDEAELARMDPGAFAAEWKWDGARVQIVAGDGGRRLFSRSGEDIGHAFPEIVAAADLDAVLDGELLVVRDGVIAPFNELQQRLGRKRPGRALIERYPAHVRLYDILIDRGEDLRPLPFAERRRRLEARLAAMPRPHFDLSPLLPVGDWEALRRLQRASRDDGSEGLMLKRLDSPYLGGRPKGHWFKWKRQPLSADCVLMYAQRGHGKRSSFYADYTFGCWRPAAGGGQELVPVGKAYFGFTDAELAELDRWVRHNTRKRFGPVRAVAPALVLEIAFDAVQPSGRHKSGVALRFPRVQRIRWDKPAAEADWVESLRALIPAGPPP